MYSISEQFTVEVRVDPPIAALALLTILNQSDTFAFEPDSYQYTGETSRLALPMEFEGTYVDALPKANTVMNEVKSLLIQSGFRVLACTHTPVYFNHGN